MQPGTISFNPVARDVRELLYTQYHMRGNGILDSVRFKQMLNPDGSVQDVVICRRETNREVVQEMALNIEKAVEMHRTLTASGFKRRIIMTAWMQELNCPVSVFEEAELLSK